MFLTDIRKEVESAQTELKHCKQATNSANREIVSLRKENGQLQATLKRYRKMVRELNQSKHNSAISPSDSASYFLEMHDRHTGIHSPYGESSLGPEDRGSPMSKHPAKDTGGFF